MFTPNEREPQTVGVTGFPLSNTSRLIGAKTAAVERIHVVISKVSNKYLT